MIADCFSKNARLFLCKKDGMLYIQEPGSKKKELLPNQLRNLQKLFKNLQDLEEDSDIGNKKVDDLKARAGKTLRNIKMKNGKNKTKKLFSWF
jgi:hypothetical protein